MPDDESVKAEIKARERCAVCRNYWPWCECSAQTQLAQLLGSRLRENGQVITPPEPDEYGS